MAFIFVAHLELHLQVIACKSKLYFDAYNPSATPENFFFIMEIPSSSNLLSSVFFQNHILF